MKKVIYTLISVACLFLLTGCFKWDSMENIEIITTIYPIEYVTDALYKDHALVSSMYPDGTDINKYTFTKKQISDFSTNDLLIYNGLGNDATIAINLLNKNKSLKIIDSTHGMEKTYGNEELWLNPSNLLMIAKNIRNGLNEYVTTTYLNEEIDDNYDKLKIALSELDATLKITATNASSKTLVVSDDSLKFLSKYGLNIISLEENDTLTEKTVLDVIDMINNGTVKYIYMLQYEEQSNTIKRVIEKTNVATLAIKTLSSITDEERNNKKDYVTLMNENIETLKLELYK